MSFFRIRVSRSKDRRPGAATTSIAPAPWNMYRTFGKWRRFWPAALLIAGMCYLLPGTIGHAPWKQDETYTFGIIYHFLQSSEWLIPVNAGQPFMEKPPLFMWTAALLASCFSPLLSLPDGARMASVLFGAITLFYTASAARSFVAGTARSAPIPQCAHPPVVAPTRASQTAATPHTASAELQAPMQDGTGFACGAVCLAAGTVLFIKHVHDLFSDVGLMAGATIALASLLKLASAADLNAANRRQAAIAYGVGVGIAFMTKGLFVPAVFFFTSAVLPLALPACRHGAYFRALALAGATAFPFVVLWPAALYHVSPALFKTWFWDNNVGRFLGFSVAELGSGNHRGFILTALFTTAFPAGPLACIGVLTGGTRRLREPATLTTIVFVVVGVTLLSLSATARQLYLLPFIPACALLGADAIRRGPAGAARVWDLVSRGVFCGLTSVTWGIAWIMQTPPGKDAALRGILSRCFPRLSTWLPIDFRVSVSAAWIVAALMTLLWIAALPFFKRFGPWRGVVSWTSGLTLVWGLWFTMLLPWLDQAKSYEPAFTAMHRVLAARWRPNDCMASIALGESESAMLHYYAGIVTRPVAEAQRTSCDWLIVQSRIHPVSKQRPDDSLLQHVWPRNWESVWEGARDGDAMQRLTLYRKISVPDARDAQATNSGGKAEETP